MITYKAGNLLDNIVENSVILQQVNCQAVMGGGFARALSLHNPEILEKYKLFCQEYPKEKLFGKCNIQDYGSYKVINIFSQYYLGACNSMSFVLNESRIIDDFYNRVSALKYVIHNLKLHNKINTEQKIIIPLIASDLGADKNLKQQLTNLEYFKKYIAPVFDDILPKFNITAYYL